RRRAGLAELTASARRRAEKNTELAKFLRSRRERVTPEDVGLPAGSRRRTAGLRREEVAQLAGVGVTWYTWLEQGRPIRASVQVLEAVARTLRLDPAERQHLFRLAEVPDTTSPDHASPSLRPQVQVILDGLNPMPASVVTERFDILAWNAAYGTLFPRMAEAAPGERNTLLYCFAAGGCCSVVENREDQKAALVAQLRAAYGHHVGDPAWTAFIRRLEAASPEFAAMWATQDVAYPLYHRKVFRHPLYPRLEMTSTSFAVQAAPGARMVVYTPDNEATRAAMERLVADPVEHHFPCWPAHQARARELLTI
ncbi:MAG TPA: helix-turn-helix transcriptional regulator, partial [Streptosporangiaceae bacterium]|nr:helix-turn-helix transcriptional regulator [Streptosporangiaceae bacterium]